MSKKYGFDSSLEYKFSKILDSLKLEWIHNYQLYNKKYDFFVPKYKVLIEIDGDYIHSNENTGHLLDSKFKKRIYKNDAFKNILAYQQGFPLLRIWEEELNKLTKENLLNKIKEISIAK